MKVPTQPGSPIPSRRIRTDMRWVATVLFGLCVGGFAQAQSPLVVPTPGGLSAQPIITSIQQAPGSNTIRWQCFGPGQFQLQRRSDVATGAWQGVGLPGRVFSANVVPQADTEFYRVNASAPLYAGQGTCRGCHRTITDNYRGSSHTNALNTLKAIGQGTNPSCLPCHTVGYGVQGGFVSEAVTPALVGVQCENCHGPSGEHRLDPDELSLRPTTPLSGVMCGGCHTGPEQPTYEEWKTTLHSVVTPSVATSFITQGTNRVNSCGPCHSGAARLAYLKGEALPNTNQVGFAEITGIGITCAVCHDPHMHRTNAVAGYQLRNPLFSTNHFSYNTAFNAGTNFLSQYDPNLNLCGHCHNMRGAVWTGTGRYPHYSPQYNVFIGSGGVEDPSLNPVPGEHRNLSKQCVTCHLHQRTVANPTPENPNSTGHSFHVSYEACAGCHADGQAIKTATKANIQTRMAEVKALLDTWATNKAPDVLRTNYGVRSWEYSTPGGLSNPPGVTTPGPPSSNPNHQALIPDGIKQARHNLYLIKQDQSYGTHNAPYTRHLLNVAEDKVNALLLAAPLAGAP